MFRNPYMSIRNFGHLVRESEHQGYRLGDLKVAWNLQFFCMTKDHFFNAFNTRVKRVKIKIL
jgi:hypothetical protein